MTAISEARQAARSIVRRLGIENPPVNLEDVSGILGINLLHQALDDELSGMAFVSDQQKYIIVNSGHHINRQRFTIAHEIGHHVLHDEYLLQGVHVDKSILKRDSLSATGKDLREIAANAFAAELLMPRSMISALIPRDFDILADDDKMSELAKLFAVSPAALNIRLISLS